MAEEWHFSPVMAEDGEAAWEILKADGAPRLLLIDWEMPRLSGLELCKRIRASDSNDPPFIIMLTSRSNSEDIAAGLGSGANDYIGKPFDETELQARLAVGKRTLELQRQLKLASQKLLHSEKMASIGSLAGGLAHEINNPLAFMQMNIDALYNYSREYQRLIDRCEQEAQDGPIDVERIKAHKSEIDFDDLCEDSEQLVKETLGGLGRVKDIVQALQSFAHTDSGEAELVDVHQLLDKALNILGSRVDSGIIVERCYGKVPELRCIPAQLQQVFLHLLNNALDALDGQGGITIRSELKNNAIVLDIKDDGKGIQADQLKSIFDPFFTTKAEGEGRGLGLSVSYGIVAHHGGRILAKSQPGAGSVFRVILPVDGLSAS